MAYRRTTPSSPRSSRLFPQQPGHEVPSGQSAADAADDARHDLVLAQMIQPQAEADEPNGHPDPEDHAYHHQKLEHRSALVERSPSPPPGVVSRGVIRVGKRNGHEFE